MDKLVSCFEISLRYHSMVECNEVMKVEMQEPVDEKRIIARVSVSDHDFSRRAASAALFFVFPSSFFLSAPI